MVSGFGKWAPIKLHDQCQAAAVPEKLGKLRPTSRDGRIRSALSAVLPVMALVAAATRYGPCGRTSPAAAIDCRKASRSG